jgi:hypothetical protein
MRTVLAGSIAVVLTVAAAHAAERRMFIIPNDADGYGVDRCLAKGEHCGTAAANSYCQTHSYAHAASFRKVDREEITGAIPGATAAAAQNAPISSPSSARGSQFQLAVTLPQSLRWHVKRNTPAQENVGEREQPTRTDGANPCGNWAKSS